MIQIPHFPLDGRHREALPAAVTRALDALEVTTVTQALETLWAWMDADAPDRPAPIAELRAAERIVEDLLPPEIREALSNDRGAEPDFALGLLEPEEDRNAADGGSDGGEDAGTGEIPLDAWNDDPGT